MSKEQMEPKESRKCQIKSYIYYDLYLINIGIPKAEIRRMDYTTVRQSCRQKAKTLFKCTRVDRLKVTRKKNMLMEYINRKIYKSYLTRDLLPEVKRMNSYG